jgi:hypothetical protein
LRLCETNLGFVLYFGVCSYRAGDAKKNKKRIYFAIFAIFARPILGSFCILACVRTGPGMPRKTKKGFALRPLRLCEPIFSSLPGLGSLQEQLLCFQ